MAWQLPSKCSRLRGNATRFDQDTSDRSVNVHQVERSCALSSMLLRRREPSMDITHVLDARHVSAPRRDW